MTPEQFVYWLNGALELGAKSLDEQQVKVIKDHLKLVLTKITPSYNVDNSVKINNELDCEIIPAQQLKKLTPEQLKINEELDDMFGNEMEQAYYRQPMIDGKTFC